MSARVGPAELIEQGDHAPAELLSLREKVSELESQVSDLQQRNDELTAQATSANIQAVVASTEATHETLSWADRKQLILQQMEAETFDAEEFARVTAE